MLFAIITRRAGYNRNMGIVIKVAEIVVLILLIEAMLTHYIYDAVSDFQNIYKKILLLLSILVPVFWLSRRT